MKLGVTLLAVVAVICVIVVALREAPGDSGVVPVARRDAPRADPPDAPASAAEVAPRSRPERATAGGGVLVITAVDADGAPLPTGLPVSVELEQPDEPLVSLRGALDEEGRARFEGVPPGEVRAWVVVDSFVDLGADAGPGVTSADRVRQVRGACAGPPAPGDVVQLDLRARLRPVTYVGRLLDEAGRTLARSRVTATCARVHADGRSNAGGYALTLDDEGGFRARHWVETDEAIVERTLELRQGVATYDERRVRVELPNDPRGELDLGTLLLSGRPLIAAGLVQDADGAPLGGVHVLLEPPKDVTGMRRETSMTTGANGAFTFRGALPEPPVGLRFSVDGHLDARLEVEPGRVDLRVTLGREAVLAGRVLHDPALNGRWLRVAGHGPGVVEESVQVDADGGFRLPNLVPGPSRVRVVVGGVEAVGFDLQLAPGENRDARLDPLDLRERLRRVRIAVQDDEGAPLPAELYRRGPDGRESARPSHRGVTLDVLAVDGVSGVLLAAGHAEVQLEAVTDDQVVTLPDGIPVTLTCAGAPGPVDEAWPGLVLVPAETGADTIPGRRHAARIGADGVARVLVARPGTYTVCAGRVVDEQRVPTDWSPTPLGTVEVPVGGLEPAGVLDVARAFDDL